MKGLNDIVRRFFPARKDKIDKKRRRLGRGAGDARNSLEVGFVSMLAGACFLLLVTCNIDSPYTDLLMEKVSGDSQEVDGARGILDESFGGDGIVTHHSAAGGDGGDRGYSVCTDSSGRILVAGKSYNGSDDDMALWRYLEDGSLDMSFGGDGIVTHHNAAGGGGEDYGRSVCIDSSGRVLVAGYSDGSYIDMALWRYLEDGSLDKDFGGDGVVTHHNAAGGDGFDLGESVYIDSSGLILVAGYSHSSDLTLDMALWRYLEDGSLDASFGDDGVVTQHNAAGGDGEDYGGSVCLDISGRILVAGSSQGDISSGLDMALWCYLEDGSPDTEFGGDGVIAQHNAAGGDGKDYGFSVCIDSRGRILVTGSSLGSSDEDMALWRYLEDGSLDMEFSGDGVVTQHNAAGGDGSDWGYSVCIDSRGRILVAGFSSSINEDDMALWRYLEDGSLDTDFGIDGVVTQHNAAGGNGDDYGISLCTDDSGRVLVAGYSYNDSDPDMALWRYK